MRCQNGISLKEQAWKNKLRFQDGWTSRKRRPHLEWSSFDEFAGKEILPDRWYAGYVSHIRKIKTTGNDIDKILLPVLRFGGGNRSEKKDWVIARLKVYFERFHNVDESFKADNSSDDSLD